MKAVKKTLEGGWCVKCDGSEEFSHYMRDFNFPVAYRFKIEGRYYGCTIDGYYKLSQTTSVFNNNELTLDELKELIDYSEAQSEQREIIGYAAPYDMYGGEIKKGSVFTLCKNVGNNNGMYGYLNKYWISKQDVESLFIPVYKKTEAEERVAVWDEFYDAWLSSDINSIDEYFKQQTKFKLVRNEN